MKKIFYKAEKAKQRNKLYKKLEKVFIKWRDEYQCGTSGCLNRLRQLATGCNLVVEFGVRKGVSTTALLLGAKKVISYDIETNSHIDDLKILGGNRWKFIQQNTLKAEIPACDMIFFDTLHTYVHLTKELVRHAHKSRKYLVFHDTITFSVRGANADTGEYIPGWKKGIFNPSNHGIRLAIDEYMIRHRQWFIKYHWPHSNGLLVLQRG